MVNQVVAWFHNLFTYLAAGRGTTAITLTFVIYILSQYPHVMDRLRQEVLAHVGPTRRPTFNDIRDMKYLRAVLDGKSSALIQFKPSPIVQKLSVYFPSYLSIAGKTNTVAQWFPWTHTFSGKTFVPPRYPTLIPITSLSIFLPVQGTSFSVNLR